MATAKKAVTKTAAKTAAKAPAKTVAKKTVKTSTVKVAATHEAISKLAHKLYLERGGHHGSDADDWIEAEKILLSR